MFTIKDDCLPMDALQECAAWLQMANWSYGWKSNTDFPFGHWNVDITNAAITNSIDVSDRLPDAFATVWNELNSAVFNGQGLLVRSYANRHTFGTEGYIHTDTTRAEDYTCIVYVDEDWKVDWGGETVFYNKDKNQIVSSVIPKFGRLVAFPGVLPHKASAISRICPRVRTTLMFKAALDPKAVFLSEEKLKGFLGSIGAKEKPHKNGSLYDHLIRTFHILKSEKAPDNLCIAGGLHSVYGTNKFKNACLPWEDTKISQLFGEEVDYLVRLFCSIDRPNVLENPDGSLSDIELAWLRCIECANLYDQQELNPKQFPNLYAFAMYLRQQNKEF